MEVLTTLLLPIILGLIASCGSIVVAIINTRGAIKTNRKLDENRLENELNNIRCQILLMVLEDKVEVIKGRLPSNYKGICDLYDKYTSLGGNSYIKTKTEEYFEWVKSLELKED